MKQRLTPSGCASNERPSVPGRAREKSPSASMGQTTSDASLGAVGCRTAQLARLYGINCEQLARDANFQAADMAASCGISLRHLERFFHENFHTTPREWVRAFRCRLAQALIRRGFSSKAVVQDLGYADHAQLCHDF